MTSSRRELLAAGAGGTASLLAGCLSSPAENTTISGHVENVGESTITVSVELIRPDGTVDVGREYDLKPSAVVEFSLDDPAEQYTIRTDVRSGGPTKIDTWQTGECRRVDVSVSETEITHEFGDS